jgi:hypothetical protein
VIATSVHAMITHKHQQRVLEMFFRLHSFVDHAHNAVHLALLGQHCRPLRASLVADVVKAKVMHNQGVPIRSLKLSGQMAGHVVVDLSEILQEKRERYLASELLYYARRCASAASLVC